MYKLQSRSIQNRQYLSDDPFDFVSLQQISAVKGEKMLSFCNRIYFHFSHCHGFTSKQFHILCEWGRIENDKIFYIEKTLCFHAMFGDEERNQSLSSSMHSG